MKLTEMQKRFAEEYIKLGNATKSAINAGYSSKTARSVGNENLTKPDIKSYIDARLEELASERIMDAQEAMELLTKIARGEEKETQVVGTPKGVEEVEVEPDLKTRITAVKEIIKRYPSNDPITEQQLCKLTADAEIAKHKARIAKLHADSLEGLNNDESNITIVDRWLDDEDENTD